MGTCSIQISDVIKFKMIPKIEASCLLLFLSFDLSSQSDIKCQSKGRYNKEVRINAAKVCDGVRDCPRGEDETGDLSECIPVGELTEHGCCSSILVDGRVFNVARDFDSKPSYESVDNHKRVIFFSGNAWYYGTSGLPRRNANFRENKKFNLEAINMKQNHNCPPTGQWISNGDHIHRPIYVFCKSVVKVEDAPLHPKKEFKSRSHVEKTVEFEPIVKSKPVGLSTCDTQGNAELFTTALVGGVTVSDQTSWSFIVHLHFNGNAACGGTIITNHHILTAAHCCVNMKSVKMGFGSINKREPKFTLEATRQDWIIHHKYFDDSDGSDRNFDICIIKTKVDIFEYSEEFCKDCVTRACLPSHAAEPGKNCWIAGWGALEFEGSTPNELQESGINIMSKNYCHANSYLREQHVMLDEICAGLPDLDGDGFTDGGVDACQGDSGGPLICDQQGRAVLTGLTSWGAGGCAKEGNPGIYGDISFYINWIRKVVGMPKDIALGEMEEIDWEDLKYQTHQGSQLMYVLMHHNTSDSAEMIESAHTDDIIALYRQSARTVKYLRKLGKCRDFKTDSDAMCIHAGDIHDELDAVVEETAKVLDQIVKIDQDPHSERRKKSMLLRSRIDDAMALSNSPKIVLSNLLLAFLILIFPLI